MANFTFDELLAKREQRKADKLKVATLTVPGSDKTLLVKTPTESKMMDIYGQFAASIGDFESVITCTDAALYHCCEQLQDPKLREALALGDPMDVVPALFTIQERSALGEQLFVFLGLMQDDGAQADDTALDNPAKN